MSQESIFYPCSGAKIFFGDWVEGCIIKGVWVLRFSTASGGHKP